MKKTVAIGLAAAMASAAAFAGSNGLSGDYQVKIDGKAVDVFHVPMPEESNGGIIEVMDRQPYSYAPFVATGEVHVCVSSALLDLSKTRILPESKGVKAMARSAGQIEFKMKPPMTIVLEPRGRHRALILSANDAASVRRPEGKGVKCFEPGFHHVGEIALKDGETLYLAPGAWVEGWLKASGRDITVCGGGVLSGACWNWGVGPRDANGKRCARFMAELSGENLTVKDVSLFSSWSWTLVFDSVTNALVDNVKVICGRVINDDGIDICRARDVEIRNSFVRCQDDCLAPKWWCENLVCTNLTLWSDAANVFRIGYECVPGSTGLAFRNELFKDIDILHLALNRRNATEYWANAAIQMQPSDGIMMEDIRYENLRFYDCGPKDIFLRLVTMLITQGYHTSEAGTIKDLTLKDINLPPSKGGMNVYLSAHDDKHPIEGLRFENVTGYGKVEKIGKVDWAE